MNEVWTENMFLFLDLLYRCQKSKLEILGAERKVVVAVASKDLYGLIDSCGHTILDCTRRPSLEDR